MVASKGNGSGIKINFTADVQKVLDGTAKIEGGLGDVREQLVQVADDSNTTYSEMTEAQQKAFRVQFNTEEEFHRATLKLVDQEMAARKAAYAKYEEIAKDASQEVQRSAEDTADEVGKSGEKGFGRATTAAKQAGTEIGDGLKDLATNTDQSIGSVGRSVGGILSGISALIPGIGGFLGAAIGAVATGVTRQWDDSAKEMEDRTKSMYDAMIESGQNYLTQDQILKAAGEITGDPAKLAEARKNAELLGIAVSDYTIALVADGPQREAVLKRTSELLDENARKGREATSQRERDFEAMQKLPLDAIVGKFDSLNAAQANATSAAQINRRVVEDVTKTYNDAGAAVDDVTRAVDELPHGKTVTITADTSQVEDAIRRLPKVLPLEARVFTRDGKRVY